MEKQKIRSNIINYCESYQNIKKNIIYNKYIDRIPYEK